MFTTNSARKLMYMYMYRTWHCTCICMLCSNVYKLIIYIHAIYMCLQIMYIHMYVYVKPYRWVAILLCMYILCFCVGWFLAAANEHTTQIQETLQTTAQTWHKQNTISWGEKVCVCVCACALYHTYTSVKVCVDYISDELRHCIRHSWKWLMRRINLTDTC